MRSLIQLECKTIAIVHFKEEEDRPMTRLVQYQVLIDPDKYSPSGAYLRFTQSEECEIHGWFDADSIVIDEVLEEIEAVAEAVNG